MITKGFFWKVQWFLDHQIQELDPRSKYFGVLNKSLEVWSDEPQQLLWKWRVCPYNWHERWNIDEFDIQKAFKTLSKKGWDYPLVTRAANNNFVDCLKSDGWLLILWNFKSCHLINQPKVCLGWKLVLCSRACVSLISSWWVLWKISPLNVVSKNQQKICG